MTELQKDISIIQNVLNDYYTEREFVYNKESQLFMCPVCCIEYIENEWIYSVIHSNIINSLCVEESIIIPIEIVKKGIDLKMSAGQFFIFTGGEETTLSEIIFADDVWEYMSLYDVSEEFAVNALTAKILETKCKGSLN